MPDTSYPNPVIPGFNPDPSCVRVGGTYYAVTSSFEYLPALPIYRSTDLRTWEHIGNVADRQSQVGLAQTPSGFGVWAPTIRHHDGLFYVIVVVTQSPVGCVVFTAQDPAGPWSDGTTIRGIVGIDPDLTWDEHGRSFVTYSGLDLSARVHHGILQAEVDLAAGHVLEEPRRLWSGTGLTAPEAPHLYQRGETWYLVIAEGGTGRGHAVSVARGPSISGPFEGCPDNPVLTASGAEDGPVLSTGHADLVETPDGGDAMLLLATRHISTGSGFSPIGRETFATSVDWTDGWPRPAAVDTRPRVSSTVERFAFESSEELLDPGWLSVGQTPQSVAVIDSDRATLCLSGTGHGLEHPRPAFVGRRQRHLRSRVETTVRPNGGAGGLGLRWDEHSFIELTAQPAAHGTTVTARLALPSLERRWTAEISTEHARLRLAVEEPSLATTGFTSGADRIRLSWIAPDGTESVLTEVDGRYWSVEVATPFTGRIIGMVAYHGMVEFDDFSYLGHGGT